MPLSEHEERCRVAFHAHLAEKHDLAFQLSEGDDPPDLSLEIDGDCYDVEITDLMEHFLGGRADISQFGIRAIQERARNGAIERLGENLSGHYQFRLVSPFGSLNRSVQQLSNDLAEAITSFRAAIGTWETHTTDSFGLFRPFFFTSSLPLALLCGAMYASPNEARPSGSCGLGRIRRHRSVTLPNMPKSSYYKCRTASTGMS